MKDSFGMGLPRPVSDVVSEVFWAECRNHKLVMQRCDECESLRYPPRPGCPLCGSDAASWRLVTGRGQVYSWQVVHHPVHPGIREHVPYNISLIELDEGPRMVGNVVDVQPDELHAGLRVAVEFRDVGDDFVLPFWHRD
jgi:uncharacterized OB-fold protein